MAIVVVIATSYLGYQQLSDKGCTGRVPLTVAAASEILPAIEQAAQQWMADGGNVNGTCVEVNVNAVNPATMAAAVARDHSVQLSGLGTAPQSVAVPDVWVPDSRTWLQRLKAEASGFTPSDGAPIAQSPVVVAMPTPVAGKFGWPDKKLSWRDLLTQMNASTDVRTGIVDPARDAAGLAGLLALAAAAPSGVKGQQAKVGALRALAADSSSLRDDMLQKFPRSADPASVANGLTAAPLSEEDVIAYNAERPPLQLAALYLDPAPPGLDYPFAIMPQVDLQRSAAAVGLRQRLQTAQFKNALAAAGLRGPDGTVGTGFSMPVGAPSATAPAGSADASQGGAAASGIDAGVINQALGSWAAITQPGRVLSVFDVSGSMAEPVPTAGGLTRSQVTAQAARVGLSLFDDKWSVGVWIFSTELDGKKPYKELYPISPLTAARSELAATTNKFGPKKGGGTGLYDTVLAAYREVQRDYVPGRINSVILFTDGKNENKDGIEIDQLLVEMKKALNPKRPVRLVIIGIGTGVDRNELKRITDVTPAGGVFLAPDPAKMTDIFLQAMASRTGATT
ncbi:substrate-binding domain-containing protein [Actinoplanes sp. NPDC051633]|uniref:VWA domain-containing protein n=1 Tax=Actinoplanes sp. NPDC051633 TaxID=3155670 RepID=UPI0034280FEA